LLRQLHSQSGAQVQQCTQTPGSHEQAVFSSSGMPQSHFFSDITVWVSRLSLSLFSHFPFEMSKGKQVNELIYCNIYRFLYNKKQSLCKESLSCKGLAWKGG